jgi:hypothetical protein
MSVQLVRYTRQVRKRGTDLAASASKIGNRMRSRGIRAAVGVQHSLQRLLRGLLTAKAAPLEVARHRAAIGDFPISLRLSKPWLRVFLHEPITHETGCARLYLL